MQQSILQTGKIHSAQEHRAGHFKLLKRCNCKKGHSNYVGKTQKMLFTIYYLHSDQGVLKYFIQSLKDYQNKIISILSSQSPAFKKAKIYLAERGELGMTHNRKTCFKNLWSQSEKVHDMYHRSPVQVEFDRWIPYSDFLQDLSS